MGSALLTPCQAQASGDFGDVCVMPGCEPWHLSRVSCKLKRDQEAKQRNPASWERLGTGVDTDLVIS